MLFFYKQNTWALWCSDAQK